MCGDGLASVSIGIMVYCMMLLFYFLVAVFVMMLTEVWRYVISHDVGICSSDAQSGLMVCLTVLLFVQGIVTSDITESVMMELQYALQCLVWRLVCFLPLSPCAVVLGMSVAILICFMMFLRYVVALYNE